jgi:hypothetical protein
MNLEFFDRLEQIFGVILFRVTGWEKNHGVERWLD